MSAAVAALDHELAPAKLLAVNERGDRLRERLNTTFTVADMPLWATGVGSMVCIHSTEDRLVELLFHAALDDGLYIARRGFMALSLTITDDHCDALIASVDSFLTTLTALTPHL